MSGTPPASATGTTSSTPDFAVNSPVSNFVGCYRGRGNGNGHGVGSVG